MQYIWGVYLITPSKYKNKSKEQESMNLVDSQYILNSKFIEIHNKDVHYCTTKYSKAFEFDDPRFTRRFRPDKGHILIGVRPPTFLGKIYRERYKWYCPALFDFWYAKHFFSVFCY